MVKLSAKKDNVKKRGRPPKGTRESISPIIGKRKQFFSDDNSSDNNSDSEEIILQLKNVKLRDIQSDNALNSSSIDIFNLDDLNTDSSDDEKISNNTASKIKEYEGIITNLQDEVNYLKEKINSMQYVQNYMDSFSQIIDLNTLDFSTGKPIPVEKTDVLCWRCCHSFTCYPCFIIWNKIGDDLYIHGNFCTPNCAIAYNMLMTDYKKDDRNSLTINVYSTFCKVPTDGIKPSREKEILKAFGGTVDIDEYRSSAIKFDYDYRYLMPPLKSIYPIVECHANNQFKKNDTEYSIRRSKPLPQTKNCFM